MIRKHENQKLALIALGGNSILAKGEFCDINRQFDNTQRSMEAVIELIHKGYNFVITHGNGPQVGQIMQMVERSKDEIAETPLGVADAMTIGSMGYMIEQTLQNVMLKQKIWRHVITVLTQVVVDLNDPATEECTKPIGKYYSEADALQLEKQYGWVMKLDEGREYRRYVPSPYPIDIVEKDAINDLLKNGYIVVAGGGGGIPVYFTEEKTLEGLDCVIEKDMVTMKLALAVRASLLVIITAVPNVFLHFGTDQQIPLSKLTLSQARYYSQKGEFASSSMAPKIQAVIEFVQADPMNKAIITDIDHLKDALEGNAGTTITAY